MRSSVATLGLLALTSSVVYACAAQRTTTAAEREATRTAASPGLPAGAVDREQVLRGRALVLHHSCSDGCHGASNRGNPGAAGWLAGMASPEDTFVIGPFTTRARNLTPDNRTGIGRFTERQLFNALRFGLRPGETPDVEITSTVPGEGNFPANPKYLAPPMPWPAWRHMSDQELWDIVAYLKHGVAPVSNQVPDSEGPPDFWASAYTVEIIGAYPAPPFPTVNERQPESRVDKVLRGRKLVLGHACGACHGGVWTPAQEGWLVGMRTPDQEFRVCSPTPGIEPCFSVRPRNLTPDPTTGIGRFTERQIFNALRYGLRPGETPDVEITTAIPGKGNFPKHPKYLAPAMPWTAWRHMSDQELRDIAAYLKLGVRPVSHEVEDSEGPPDFWAERYKHIGPYPPPPFPTANERVPAPKAEGGRRN